MGSPRPPSSLPSQQVTFRGLPRATCSITSGRSRVPRCPSSRTTRRCAARGSWSGPADRRKHSVCTTPANYPETVQRDDIHFHQTEEMAWKYLGTAGRIEAWAKLIEQAQAAASTPEQQQRVTIFTNSIWADMLEGRQKWGAKQKR